MKPETVEMIWALLSGSALGDAAVARPRHWFS